MTALSGGWGQGWWAIVRGAVDSFGGGVAGGTGEK